MTADLQALRDLVEAYCAPDEAAREQLGQLERELRSYQLRLAAQREHLVTLAKLVEHSGNEDVRRVARAALAGELPARLTEAKGEHETRADRAVAAAIYYGIRPNGGDAHAAWIEDASRTDGLFEHELRHLTRIAGQVAAHRHAHASEIDADNKRLVEALQVETDRVARMLRDNETLCEADPSPTCSCAGCETRRERNDQENADG